MQREPERVERARDQVGAGAGRLERIGEPRAGRPLAVETDGQGRRLRDAADELARLVRFEPSGRVVDQRARGAEVAQLPSLLDERVGVAAVAGAVDEPGMKLLARGDDRLAGLAQVRDVVERVVQAEDVDPVLRRRRDETPDEVGADRARADEKRPRSASPSGVVVRPFSARMRSQGLSTPRRTAESKTPPPETSRQAKPAESSTSASRSSSAVGTWPARGSCESRRMVVSISRGTW